MSLSFWDDLKLLVWSRVADMECPSIISVGYGKFSSRIHEKAGGKRLPLEGSIEVTERCNMQCAHCYISLPAGDIEACRQELSCDEIFGIIDQVAQEGCLWLLFTGGEPFLRPDFPEIYMQAKRKGLLITIFTNGTLLTPKIVDQLAEYPPFSIEITLYGRSKEVYERVTGVPGSFQQCMTGINLLLERKLPLKLKTVVMRMNQHELPDIKDFAKSLGVDFRYDAELNMGVDARNTPARQRITPEEVVQLDQNDSKRMKGWQEFCARYPVPVRSDRIYQCGAGMSTFHINSFGRLSCCMMARNPSFDLRESTFHQGWLFFFPQVLEQEWTSESKCRDCSLTALCNRCPGIAQLEHGNQEAPIDYHCLITHLRANAIGYMTNNLEKTYDKKNKTV